MKPPKQKTEDEIKELEAAKAQARESAEKNRNLLFGSLLIFIFLIFVVLQTTDVDLLVGATIKLPFENVDIPLFAFCLLSSPLAFLVHLNLLRNIEAHAVKLQAWQDIDKTLKAADLFHFIFDFAAIDRESSLAGLTRWFSQLVIYWLGALTLLLIFWRFTDYQNSWITVLHAVFLFIDLIVLRIMRERILDILSNNESQNANKSAILPARQTWKWHLFLISGGWACARRGKAEKLSQIVGFTIVLVSYVQGILFIAFTFSSLDFEKWINLAGNTLAYKRFLLSEPPTVKDFSFLLPILIIDQQENLLAFNESLLRLQHELSSDPDEKFGMWFMDHGVGVDLRKRNLRYAQLPSADLRKAQLMKADLFYADLSRAKLQGADLTHAKLQRTYLNWAELQDANLRQAKLQGANLTATQSKDAILSNAKLHFAKLSVAELQGANLYNAELHFADLSSAKLQGANLRDAELQGADLRGAKLQGASLSDSELQGAYLVGAYLQSVDLKKAHLQGADFKQAHLQGADLRWAELQGADLKKAHLQGADLRAAKLRGTDLTDAILQDVFTDKDLQWKEGHNPDWNTLRQLADNQFADNIDSGNNQISPTNKTQGVSIVVRINHDYKTEAKQKYLKRLGEAEARIVKGRQKIPKVEPVSLERLVKTLTETLCSMRPEVRKYALKGVVTNYGFLPSDLSRMPKPTPKMQIVHNHFKVLKAPLDCKKNS